MKSKTEIVGCGTPNRDQAPEFSPIEDRDIFLARRSFLMEKYAGRFVAIREGDVVADAPTRRGVQQILESRFGKGAYAFVREVCTQAFESEADEAIVTS